MTKKIKFIYSRKQDQKCLLRYSRFIKKHGSIWGRNTNIKPIIKLTKINLEANVSEIVIAYNKIFKVKPFKIKGYLVTTPFSMINDDEKFNDRESLIFYSIYNLFGYPPSIVLAHEIFHIYFEKYTQRKIPNYEEVKEYFTVIMNDVFDKEVSKGYPQHQEIRVKILNIWKNTHSIDECIKIVC